MPNKLDNTKIDGFIIKLKDEKNVLDLVKNGIAITNTHSQILYINPAFTTITGYTKAEVLGQNPGMLHSGYHDKEFYKAMWDAIIKHGFWEGEIWNRRKSGEVYPEFLTISKIYQTDPDEYFYISIFSDITFLKSDIQKKYHLAFYDPLTELPNRNLFLERIEKIASQNKKDQHKKTSLFYMDLDGFKHVNDTFGHCVGDQLLKYVGKRLASITREEDTIARIGGDEFAAIISTDGNDKFIKEFSTRILNTIEKPFIIDNNVINISISIGISKYLDDADSIEVLVSNADKAMYSAKKNKSKIQFFDPETMG